MATGFDPEQALSAVGIGTVDIRLFDGIDDEGALSRGVHAHIQIIMSDGSVRIRSFDLLPYISAQERQTLISFAQAIRTRAESSVLTLP